MEPGLVRTEFPESFYDSANESYAGKEYAPLEAGDIAAAILHAIGQPPRVSINEILVRPTQQPN